MEKKTIEELDDIGNLEYLIYLVNVSLESYKEDVERLKQDVKIYDLELRILSRCKTEYKEYNTIVGFIERKAKVFNENRDENIKELREKEKVVEMLRNVGQELSKI